MIQVLDKTFVPYLSEQTIQQRVSELAADISSAYAGKNPLFIGILNGAFMFASDLYRQVTIPSTISFIKLASYKGTTSSGSVITAIGLEETCAGRHIVLVEDIVDTGRTMFTFLQTLAQQQPASVSVCTLLHKPDALQHPLYLPYIGFSIPDKFVVGYGLDYDGYGRNHREIFQIAENG